MRKLNIFRRIAFVAALGLLLLLIVAQSIPLTYSEADWLVIASVQSARGQRIAKNAFTLAYRPDEERAQAVSELQNLLPVWENQQEKLQEARNADLHALVIQSQPDFMAMDTAARKLLAHPTGKTDLVQVSIIAQHERNYSLLMLQVSTLMQQRIDDFNTRLIITQNALVVLVIVLLIIKFTLAEKTRAIAEKALATQETMQETIKELQEALAKLVEEGKGESSTLEGGNT